LLAPVDAAPGAPHVVIAATHDQELVDLLAGVYAPYHFTDRVDEHGLVFDFQLRPGPARTRNAIALLARRGAPPELVRQATARAQSLTASPLPS
jgi:DNA mismatch repair ATPase MutS